MGINGLEKQFFENMTYSKRRNSCPPQAFGFLSGPEWNNLLVQRGRRLLQNSIWNDAHRSTNNLATADQPLKFHNVHGQNIELLNGGRRAKRKDSFCRGICFSNRPIKIGERVYLKCVATSASWSGVLRFGFTSTDPNTLQGQTLPRYACPDMTNKAGNWAKAVSESYAIAGSELCFYVTRSGNVFYGVNDEEKQLFFSGVNASVPLWALLDIYGNTSCVEFINPPLQPLNNTVPNQSTVSGTPNNFTSHVSSLTVSADNMNNNRTRCNRLRNLSLSKYYGSAPFSPLSFHNVCGRNVCISPDKCTVTRINDECGSGYVFTSRPIRCGEKIVLRVLGVDCSSTGGLVFGFTSCDPSNLKPSELPDDADLFLDRLEYWVVNKDTCRSPEMQDELGFHLTREGEVMYSRNNNRASTLMHVEKTLPLWAFFDIYGNVQQIQMLGTIMPQYPELRRPLPRSRSTTSVLTVNLPPLLPQRHSMAPTTLQLASLPAAMFRCASQPTFVSTPKPHAQPVSMPATPSSINDSVSDNETNECHVCYERPVNAVLYMCGHMCMCFECAQAVKQLKTALCPICRQEIKDVIKIYRS